MSPADTSQFTAEITVKINGAPLSEEALYDLQEVTVDSDFFLPAMAVIRLKDFLNPLSGALTYGDNSTYDIGKALQISIKTDLVEKSDIEEIIFKGEITALEPQFDPDGVPYFVIRGYDKAHRLMQGKKSRTFLKQKISDTVSKICGENGLSASVTATSEQFDHIFQYNQNDWEYICTQARSIGYQVYVDDSSLHFEPLDKTRGSDPDDLIWRENLRSFQPRISVAGQAAKAQGQTLLVTKENAKSTVADNPKSLKPKIGYTTTVDSALKNAGAGTPIDYLPTTVNMTTDTIKKQAEADIAFRESNYIQAEAEPYVGDPRILAGRKVKISDVGKRFTGTYLITKAVHEWRHGKYSVHISLSGSRPHTLQGMLQSEEPRSDKIYGLVRGIVTNLKDDQNLGRVKVKYPGLDDQLESGWARIAAPGAGKDRGMFFFPELNDEVVIIFENGDPNAPYIIGGLWNKKDTMPKGKAACLENGVVNERVIRSNSGHIISLEDKKGEEQILIQDKTGKNSITIISKNNAMTLKTDGDFTIEAGGKFIVKSTGDMTMDSKAKSTITCASSFSVDAKADAAVKTPTGALTLKGGAELKGLKVDVKGDTMASINGGPMTQIQGGIVKIN